LDTKEHVSERFRRMLGLYRKPDGSDWGGQDLQNATGGAVARSYVANLKKGRIENPGLAKFEAISGAMGFPPALWFGDADEEGRAPDEALLAALKDETFRSILEEA
jgi:transcriptional regulator with XRE-family HTH domain